MAEFLLVAGVTNEILLDKFLFDRLTPRFAAAVLAAVTPGIISNGIPIFRRTEISSEILPKTDESPPFNLTTDNPF